MMTAKKGRTKAGRVKGRRGEKEKGIKYFCKRKKNGKKKRNGGDAKKGTGEKVLGE